VVSDFAKKGLKIVNHAHDFAEDRPVNLSFLREILEQLSETSVESIMYPVLKNYHFATLNHFDYQRLIDFGIREDNVHFLPNPVSISEKKMPTSKESKRRVKDILGLCGDKLLITYPVRVIRRKNIGEYILFSELFKEEADFIVTLPPQNPIEVEIYRKWVAFCNENNMNIIFEAGLKVDFEDVICGSDLCFTTSVMEGFGMVFMEPWLMNTPVAGRDIEYVTKDLKKSGIVFPFLYKSLIIRYNDTKLDFSQLAVKEQMDYILKIKSSKDLKKQLYKDNPLFSNILKPIDNKIVKDNQEIIKNNYSLEKYGERLEGVYKRVT
jgi:glycosyltransferase involved in cell wall biosynthesis